MKTKKMVIFAFSIGLLISMSAVVAFAANGFLNRGQEKPLSYAKNKSGQTYGSAAFAVSVETEPDLISAVGVDGTEGYVYSKDLNGDMPKTPEEAVAQTNAIREKTARARSNEPVVVRTIPLYDVDGKTVIGEFAITNSANDIAN